MKTQSLEAVFQSAVSRVRSNSLLAPAPSREHPLLAALQGSVTSFDQIVQRRIGMEPEAMA